MPSTSTGTRRSIVIGEKKQRSKSKEVCDFDLFRQRCELAFSCTVASPSLSLFVSLCLSFYSATRLTATRCPELIAANVIPAAVARPPARPPARPVLRLRNTAFHCVTRFYSRRQHRYSPFAGQCNL